MQIEQIITWDGVIYKAEKGMCKDCAFYGGRNNVCILNATEAFECCPDVVPDMIDRNWQRIGTMPKVGK